MENDLTSRIKSAGRSDCGERDAQSYHEGYI